MRLKPWVIIVAVILLIPVSWLGLKVAKRVYLHMKRPKIVDNRDFMGRDFKIFVASSLDRVFQNGNTLLKPAFADKANLSAAANEYESFQVVVSSPIKDQPGVYLKPSDLVSTAAKDVIVSNNITWRAVEYVPTKEPYYPVKFIGPWPDPLVPVKSFDIKAGQVQPFWVTVYVPKGTAPGHYQGSITVKGLNFDAYQIPITLQVYGFTLPAESHLKTAFDFYGHMTKVRYPQGKDESELAWHARLDDLNDKFIVNMLKHRMNPILNIDPTSQAELSNIDRYRAYGLTNFAIGKKGGTFDNNWPKDDPSIEELFNTYRTYGEMLKLNHLLDYTYIYTWDEGPMDNPLVPKIASMIHRAYPGLRNMVCYHGIWDPKKNPNWGKDIDIWTFQIDDFNEELMKTLQKMGVEMWMYISGPSSTTTPNLAMDFESIGYRIIPWMCWKYDIRGFLYWCVNWWPTEDPFKNARNTKWAQNGNGLLYYPGSDGPWDSLRVEIFRDGMEDYEYIQILLDKLRILRSSGLEKKFKDDFEQSVKLLTMDDSMVASIYNYTLDGEYLKSRRDAIARQIEKLDLLMGAHGS